MTQKYASKPIPILTFSELTFRPQLCLYLVTELDIEHESIC
jgi:hypothetical protein